MAVAERTNRIVQMGARALLMQAGLPPPFWAHAVRYFGHDARAPDEGEMSWKRRFGREFAAPP
eukprot:2312603-Pyramimonas_sp.AAC.1